MNYSFPPFTSQLTRKPVRTAERQVILSSWILANVKPYNIITDNSLPVVKDSVYLCRQFTSSGRQAFTVTPGQFEYVMRLCGFRPVDEASPVWKWQLSPSSPVFTRLI